MTFVRTVLGDIAPERLGITYAHEHLIIAGGRPVELFPDFRLDSVDEAAAELRPAIELGLGAVVDAMPCDAGRDVTKLAALSRAVGIHVIAPTGVHHERYYDDRHWSVRLDAPALATLFIAEVIDGIDELDYAGPVVRRAADRAGVVKVAGSTGGPSARDRPIFEAAAATQAGTGVPILTHCEGGTGGLEQVALLAAAGGDPGHVALSHVDKVVDRGYHRELCATGVALEYDGAFRWADAPNGTLQLLEWLAEDGLLDHVLLGHDAARRGYWSTLGGSPGLAFLLGPFREVLRERGFTEDDLHRLFVANPARVFAFRDGDALEEGR
jgi:phosphotriesterase-related protein